MNGRRRIVIIGGGISGLSTAYFLSQRLDPASAEIRLTEASPRWGGMILTQRVNGFVLEGGPDSFLSQKPEALELCKELGLEERLIRSLSAHPQVYLFSQGALRPLPLGLLLRTPVDTFRLLRSPLLSWKGRFRAALEPLIAPSRLEDESVANFVGRRLGQEVVEKFAAPLLAGVYGGDTHELSIRSTLPQLYQAEKRQGRLTRLLSWKAVSRAEREKREAVFFSLRGGMKELVEALVEALIENVSPAVDLHSQTEVLSVSPQPRGFRIHVRDQGPWSADHVVLATPAYISATLLSESWPSMAKRLQQIPYAGAMIVCLAYPGNALTGRQGSGFLVSRSEKKILLACTWVDQKFPHRCPKDSTLLRCFVQGFQDGAGEDQENLLLSAVKRELREILNVNQAPLMERVYGWERALPQYLVGHSSRVEDLNRDLKRVPGLHLVGNYLDGVGISDCIRHARRVGTGLG